MREPGFIKRSPRVDTNFMTKLIDSDGNVVPVTVVDLRREGCRLETDATLKIGEHVQIEVPKYGNFAEQAQSCCLCCLLYREIYPHQRLKNYPG